eukprot:TRINITY_DN9733_c0_g1_i4.p1 TRINITY_DN9733_c0_g1~~TRINITY_DN9733_c0_g1_i4.p1  ORF type:complete len:816 (+),score=160.56 TRINITY_DN9733_c0_g1_i4:239-2686(+)
MALGGLLVENKFILRRPESILENDLPPRHEIVVRINLSTIQQELYEKFVLRLSNESSMRAFSLLSMLADHPCVPRETLIKQGQMSDRDFADKMWILAPYEEMKSSVSDWKQGFLSSKMQVLSTIIQESKRIGDRVVVFSRWSLSLSLIEEYLIGWGCSFSRIDGDVSLEARVDIIERFQLAVDIDVLLVSTLCGEGINLSAANRVVILEPGWNPSHDYQAALRVHRYGQSKPVFIYRLVCNETIDTCAFVRQMGKVELSKWAVDGVQTFSTICEDPSWKRYLSKPEMLVGDLSVNLSATCANDSISLLLLDRFGLNKAMQAAGCITAMNEEKFLFVSDWNQDLSLVNALLEDFGVAENAVEISQLSQDPKWENNEQQNVKIDQAKIYEKFVNTESQIGEYQDIKSSLYIPSPLSESSQPREKNVKELLQRFGTNLGKVSRRQRSMTSQGEMNVSRTRGSAIFVDQEYCLDDFSHAEPAPEGPQIPPLSLNHHVPAVNKRKRDGLENDFNPKRACVTENVKLKDSPRFLVANPGPLAHSAGEQRRGSIQEPNGVKQVVKGVLKADNLTGDVPLIHGQPEMALDNQNLNDEALQSSSRFVRKPKLNHSRDGKSDLRFSSKGGVWTKCSPEISYPRNSRCHDPQREHSRFIACDRRDHSEEAIVGKHQISSESRDWKSDVHRGCSRRVESHDWNPKQQGLSRDWRPNPCRDLSQEVPVRFRGLQDRNLGQEQDSAREKPWAFHLLSEDPIFREHLSRYREPSEEGGSHKHDFESRMTRIDYRDQRTRHYSRNEARKKCWFYAHGKCVFGDRCKNEHVG